MLFTRGESSRVSLYNNLIEWRMALCGDEWMRRLGSKTVTLISVVFLIQEKRKKLKRVRSSLDFLIICIHLECAPSAICVPFFFFQVQLLQLLWNGFVGKSIRRRWWWIWGLTQKFFENSSILSKHWNNPRKIC